MQRFPSSRCKGSIWHKLTMYYERGRHREKIWKHLWCFVRVSEFSLRLCMLIETIDLIWLQ